MQNTNDREAIVRFVRPLLQDLDGQSRLPEVERVARIASRLHDDPDEMKYRDLLFYLHPLGSWLRKTGNRSRALLALKGIATDQELFRVENSISRLEVPQTALEIALASALLIDRAGVRGAVQQLASARREGLTIDEAVQKLAEDEPSPTWMSPKALEWLNGRKKSRIDFIRSFQTETELLDS